jgi:AAA+ ATPase superfamily predicted ATPase
MKILARETEKKLLREIWKSQSSEFLAVYGRRRVGKTFLIKNFFENKGLFFHITGTPFESGKQQLWNFSHIYREVFCKGEPYPVPKSWQEAFHQLKDAIKKEKTTNRIVLFFDELPWLVTKKSGFVEALSYLWNRYLESDPRIILVVCGSAASWMITNIIDSRGGLYNRITRRLSLQPFNLCETEIYLKGKKVNLSRKQIVEVYMAIGGVAAYLDMVKPGKSSSQIISEICFNPQSPLHGEFDRLFKSLFSKSEIHTKIIRALLNKRSGMDRSELFTKAGVKSGSVQTRIKKELIESGFIAETSHFGKRKQGALFRLSDEYSAFYLKWHKEVKSSRLPVNPNHWMMLHNSTQFKTWAGYAFENVCLNHIQQIAKALGFSGIIYSFSSWSYKPKDRSDKGVQIDLLIERSDNCINLCEIKFYDGKFTVTKEYSEKLLYKKEKFIEVTKTKKTVFTTLITSFGAKENSWYLESVTNQLSMNDLFIPI